MYLVIGWGSDLEGVPLGLVSVRRADVIGDSVEYPESVAAVPCSSAVTETYCLGYEHCPPPSV